MSGDAAAVSPFLEMSRAEWATLRAGTPMTLQESDLDRLSGINEELSLAEVEEVYLPLSRLLSMYVRAVQELHETTATFLGTTTPKVPFVIGIAGSVAVGKSTTARVLQALLSRWPSHPEVALVTTDGFLLDNEELARLGLMNRKGFPESYDRAALLRFVSAVKSGEPEVRAPVYSHLTYDIVPDEHIVVRRPDVLIVEGLNVLQTGSDGPGDDRPFVSDFFDFSVYVDADLADIRTWYVERFLTLRTTAFRDPVSYFRTYADLGEREARSTALRIWTEINEVNLIENIQPTRSRATLVLEKGTGHEVRSVRLRKL